AELAARTGAKVTGESSRRLVDVGPLESAGPEHLSFLDNRKFLPAFRETKAGAAFVHPDFVKMAPPGLIALVTPAPYRAYALAAQAFYPDPVLAGTIAPSAVIDGSAKLGEECVVGPQAVIGPGVEIGRRCQIGAHAVIGAGVVLGDEVRVGAHVTLSHSLVGSRVRLLPGARIGQDGFGFAPSPSGHLKVPQLGRVVIGDDVEIGANTTIDRGAISDTVIGAGSKIDNLVHLAHNVELGRGCVLVGQVGVAGSSKLGDFVMAGGQAGIAGHLRVGSGAQIGAQAGVMRDIEPGAKMLGAPALPAREFFRQVAVLAQMARKKGE
ncbi:MAG TPA: UDP-3-O-(3-hydroxymyristoyl)glucosamine N-acyltransferase, partial [Stellaceae bacterium]|nr:UDP-3-O-(3-hydroxymyristoyl)glucosamine N-acyltransferase [Stellaceae bacterium]